MTIKPVIKKYQYSDWKNDENAKKFLLEVRQNTHNYYEQQKKQKGIDDKIESKRQELIKEWDKMTSAKEHKQILICYESFKMKVNGSWDNILIWENQLILQILLENALEV